MTELQIVLPGGAAAAVAGVGLLCPAGIGLEGLAEGRAGSVPGFRAMAYIADRKSTKLMTRAVQLGVSAVRLALSDTAGWESVIPERRGMFVGASPQPGEPDELRPAFEASGGPDGVFDLARFAVAGVPLIHPLWLVRGLSNNVLGFASAAHDLQGVNSNYCDGLEGGWTALRQGVLAVAEGRAELVVAGGADCLIGAEPILAGRRCGEGAAFLALRPVGAGEAVVLDLTAAEREMEAEGLGFLGAAAWPIAVARVALRSRALLNGAVAG